MKGVTMFRFAGIWGYDRTSRMLRVIDSKKTTLLIMSFEDGVATVEPMNSCEIKYFTEVVAGCFNQNSNFEQLLKNVFNCEKNARMVGIKFNFNGATVLVTMENANKDKIYAEWQKVMKSNLEKYRIQQEAYMKTPEYRAEQVKKLKKEIRKKKIEEDVIMVDKSTNLLFKDENAAQKWEKWVTINSKDNFSKSVVAYARRWGKYMQHLVNKHNKTVAQIAAEAAKDVSNIGATTYSFTYRCALTVLTQYWKYGEELKQWYNSDSKK